MEIEATNVPPTPEFAPNPNAAANRELSRAVRTLNGAGTAGPGRQFSFSIDPQTRRGVIRIVNASTHELIEQIPSEYVLRVAQALGQNFPLKAPASSDKSFVEIRG